MPKTKAKNELYATQVRDIYQKLTRGVQRILNLNKSAKFGIFRYISLWNLTWSFWRNENQRWDVSWKFRVTCRVGSWPAASFKANKLATVRYILLRNMIWKFGRKRKRNLKWVDLERIQGFWKQSPRRNSADISLEFYSKVYAKNENQKSGISGPIHRCSLGKLRNGQQLTRKEKFPATTQWIFLEFEPIIVQKMKRF